MTIELTKNELVLIKDNLPEHFPHIVSPYFKAYTLREVNNMFNKLREKIDNALREKGKNNDN